MEPNVPENHRLKIKFLEIDIIIILYHSLFSFIFFHFGVECFFLGGAPGELRGVVLWVWWWWWRDHILGVGWILTNPGKVVESVYRIS